MRFSAIRQDSALLNTYTEASIRLAEQDSNHFGAPANFREVDNKFDNCLGVLLLPWACRNLGSNVQMKLNWPGWH
jgi:hypothetical protein